MFLLQHGQSKAFVSAYTRTEIKFNERATYCPSFSTKEEAEVFMRMMRNYISSSVPHGDVENMMKHIQVYEV